MSDPQNSETPLRTTFKIKLNGDTLAIATVGQAYQFLTNFKSVEWMEFRSLHEDAVAALEGAADNAMLVVQATNAVRALFVSAKLVALRATLRSLDCVTLHPGYRSQLELRYRNRQGPRRSLLQADTFKHTSGRDPS
ncbi:hypothetical protein ACVW0I_003829 [Bradyrhizobium sp. LM6.11]